MAEALRAKSVAPAAHTEEQQKRGRKQQQRQRTRGALAAKSFEALSASEKDMLLKLVAVRLGLIKDSDDA